MAFQGALDDLRTRWRKLGRWFSRLHPGEFRGLFPDLASQRELDPWGAAEAAADRTRAVVLLKGVLTVVAVCAGRPALTVAAGNPGLATGGSGDVLSGIIGTALAQELEPRIAAALAQALGRAADTVVRAGRPGAFGRWTWSPRWAISGAVELLRRSPPPPTAGLLELTRPQTL